MGEEWWEEIYEVGNIKTVVAFHKNIPGDIQIKLNDLLISNYDKLIFNVDLFDAAMLLLVGGYRPRGDRVSQYHYNKLTGVGSHKYFLHNKSGAHLKELALTYIASRQDDETIVMVFKDGELIGTLTLTLFEKRSEFAYVKGEAISGFQHMQSDEFLSYPDRPGLEIGRLAKGPEKDLLSSVAMTTAFTIIERYYVNRPELLYVPVDEMYICGETFKHVIDGLSMFFPIITMDAVLNWSILNHPLGMYFLTRDVLGSFKSNKQLIQLIDYYKKWGKSGSKIIGLLERGTGKPIEKLEPKKYKVFFFQFFYGDPETQIGFRKMDEMVKEMVEADEK